MGGRCVGECGVGVWGVGGGVGGGGCCGEKETEGGGGVKERGDGVEKKKEG